MPEENSALINHLKKLAAEGETLLNSGKEITLDPAAPVEQEVLDWLLRCNSLLAANYGKASAVYENFSRAYTLRLSVNFLVALAAAAGEVQKTLAPAQTTIRQSAAGKAPGNTERIMAVLEQTVLISKKAEATTLVARLEQELAEPQPDWEKVTNLLKSSFDYSLALGCELAALVHSKFVSR
jgi:hypothetical protein